LGGRRAKEGVKSSSTLDVRLIGHDPDVLAAFYVAHLGLVQRFVARRVSDPHLAADLTADIFVAAIESAGTYNRHRGEPAAWLTGVARNVIHSEFFRRAHQQETARRISGRRLLDTDSIAALVERIDAERAARTVYEALASLPERDRALVELVAVDGLSVAEAAAVLGVKPGTARVRLHRSRARVQSLLPVKAAQVTEVAP